MRFAHSFKGFWLLSAALLQCAALSWAGAGEIGIGGAAGAAFPIGTSDIRSQGGLGHALGVHVGYDLTDQFNAELSYDNLYVQEGIRIEPLIASGVWHKKMREGLEPFLQLGLGVGRGAEGGSFNNFAAKAGIGLIYSLTESLSVGPQVIYHHVGDQGSAVRSVHTLTPGVFATYHFRVIQTQA